MLSAAGILSAQTLPDVMVENMDGEQVSIWSVVTGKPAIISFWGVTCKPCINELNALNDAMEDWLAEVDFDIIAVSVDDSRFFPKAKSMTQGYGWQFNCVFDKNQDLKRARQEPGPEAGHECKPYSADIHRGCIRENRIFPFRLYSGQ